MKVLVPIDGSENSLRALRHAIELNDKGAPVEIHILNVQPSLGGNVTSHVGSAVVKDFHREEAEKCLAAAKKLLDGSGLAYKAHVIVGPAGESIAEFAKQSDVDKIVIGNRGLGKLAGILLGSVATDVIKHASVPVTLVK